MRRGAIIALLAVVCAMVGACRKGSPPAPSKLTIAAAASARFALPEIIAEFEEANPGVTIEVVYGASGSLYHQVVSKAPFDVLLSADEHYPAELVKSGHAVGESVTRYATGRLALWVPHDSPVDISGGLGVLTHESVKKVAIANPKLAPYGAAAEEALKNAGVYDSIKRKLVLGENIAHTTQLAESGAAQAAIIALSMTLAPEMKDKGRSWEIPESAHTPIVQSACISVHARDPALARKFLAFMQAAPATSILERHGFGIPGG